MHSKTHSVLFNATQLHNLLFSQVFLQWVGVEFNASIIPPLLALVLQIREVDFNDEAALALPVLLILLRGAPPSPAMEPLLTTTPVGTLRSPSGRQADLGVGQLLSSTSAAFSWWYVPPLSLTT